MSGATASTSIALLAKLKTMHRRPRPRWMLVDLKKNREYAYTLEELNLSPEEFAQATAYRAWVAVPGGEDDRMTVDFDAAPA